MISLIAIRSFSWHNLLMFCDFHTHLHQYEVTDSILEQIYSNKIITVASSMDIDSYKKTKKMAIELEMLYGKALTDSKLIIPTFGIHPWNAYKFCDSKGYFNLTKEIDLYMNESPIIGEIGLDYCWTPKESRKCQVQVFETFLHHCNKHKKYCVIHTKGAEKQVLDILSNFPNAKPIIHWYHGPEKYFNEIIKRNYYCTFGVEVSHSSYIRKLLRQIPVNLLLAETDNPESEVWLGGKRKDPLLIENVVSDMATSLVEKSGVANQLKPHESHSVSAGLDPYESHSVPVGLDSYEACEPIDKIILQNSLRIISEAYPN